MKNFLEPIKEEIAKAKKSLKIASPWIDKCMMEKILEGLPKGVKLEVILNNAIELDWFDTPRNLVFGKVQSFEKACGA